MFDNDILKPTCNLNTYDFWVANNLKTITEVAMQPRTLPCHHEHSTQRNYSKGARFPHHQKATVH